MKKTIFFVGIVFFTVGLIAFYPFYRQNLRGIAPAVNPPVADISRQLETESPNATDFPLVIPPGFAISVFAKNLGDPRVMTWDPVGRLLVSIPGQGKVVALADNSQEVVVNNLSTPHGLAWKDGKLYIAEVDKVAVYDYDPKTAKATHKQKIIDLPAGGNHVTRTIGFGPDGRLYISIGSSCNVCVENDWRRAKILTADASGSNLKVFASGLRNAVFFTWNPSDGRMWATNMGRDLLGDDIPPETIDIVAEGNNFGWPYCYGKKVWDQAFDGSAKARDFCKTADPSFIDYQAHSAPLGLAFIPDTWPEEYRNNVLVAMHGSWNRSVPTGYKIVRFIIDNKGKYAGAQDFITGWLTAKGALGRPVDLLFDTKGNLFVSDDKAGVIYRITYQSPQ